MLRPGGALCLAVVHPYMSARDEDTLHTVTFRVSQPYLQSRPYVDRVERDGLPMTFNSVHRPLSAYTSALFASGLAITGLSEHGAGVIPWPLTIRADKINR